MPRANERKAAAKASKSPKGAKRGARGGPSGRVGKQAMPSFEPFVNRSAGPSALGVRVGFPAERTVSLNFATYTFVTNTAGIGNSHQWRLNSCFDPDFTATGTQPLGFDQWSLFYNHYVVESCDYQVVATPNVAGYAPIHYAVHISDDSTVPNTIVDLTELGAQTAIQSSGQPVHIFAGKVSMAKFFNRGSIATDSDLRAAITANPNDVAFLTVRAQPMDGASTVTSSVVCKLTFRVRFMEPKDLAPSTSRKADTEALDEGLYEYVRIKKESARTKEVPGA